VPLPKPCDHVDGERGELIIAGEHVATLLEHRASKASPRAVERRDRTGAERSRCPQKLGAARERAFASCPTCCGHARMSVVDGFAPVAGLRAETASTRSTIVGAFP